MIVEGEMDALLIQSQGINAVTSTHGASTFKEEWVQHFNPDLEHYICYDNRQSRKKWRTSNGFNSLQTDYKT
jgi:hypothetical protein